MKPANGNIFKEIDAWISVTDKDKDKLPSRIAPYLTQILKDFSKFCEEYFNDFFESPDNSKTDDKSINEEAINAVLFEYWEPLRYATMQQFSVPYRELFEKGYASLSQYENGLNAALQIETKNKIPVILYFEKTGKAKRYPFRGIYLIGVPLSAAYNGNWNSIAHELGHQVYWNAKFNIQDKYVVPPPGSNFFDEDLTNCVNDLIDQKKELIKQTFSAWTEEIFADIIGTRIAKEEYKKSTWNRVITRAQKAEDLFTADEEHPIPYLLPYITSSVLGQSFDEALWSKYYEKIAINIKDAKKRDAIKLSVLRDCFESYVKGINSKLGTINLEPWVSRSEDDSPFQALKRYILSNDPDLQNSSLTHQSLRKTIATQISSANNMKDSRGDIEKNFRFALLIPKILDKAEDWRCSVCYTPNSSGISVCSNCYRPRNIVIYIKRLIGYFPHV